MKVFFTCAYQGKTRYQKDYDRIFAALEKQGVEITSTEDKSYLEQGEKARDAVHLPYQEDQHKYVHYNSIKRAIFESDAVIIEASYPSFRLGHEATLAAQNKKPTLIMSQHRNYSNLMDLPHFFGTKYSPLETEEIIEKFIRQAGKKVLRHRFNMFISDEHKEFLDDESKKEKTTRSEYLRTLVEKEMP